MKKTKTADAIATEIEKEVKRLLYQAMLLRGKKSLTIKVQRSETEEK